MTPPIDSKVLWAATRPDGNNLIPCVAQDLRTRAVLLVAWVNEEALQHTLRTGFATYWSRSRACLWEKGATSGRRQKIIDVRLDCDGDTLLYIVEAALPACHEGSDTCFSHRRIGNGWQREPQDLTNTHDLFQAEWAETLTSVPAEPLEQRGRALREALMHGTDEVALSQSAEFVRALSTHLRARGLHFRDIIPRLSPKSEPED